MEKTIKVGKNQEVKSLEEALKMVPPKRNNLS